MIEYPESLVYTQAHFDIYKKANGLEFIDVNVTPDATSAEILITDLTFSARSYFNFGSLRQYYRRPSFNTSVIAQRLRRVPIQEIFLIELMESSNSYLRFYPDYWLFEFSINVAFN